MVPKTFDEWLSAYPKSMQENVRASAARGESMTFDAWQAATTAAKIVCANELAKSSLTDNPRS